MVEGQQLPLGPHHVQCGGAGRPRGGAAVGAGQRLRVDVDVSQVAAARGHLALLQWARANGRPGACPPAPRQRRGASWRCCSGSGPTTAPWRVTSQRWRRRAATCGSCSGCERVAATGTRSRASPPRRRTGTWSSCSGRGRGAEAAAAGGHLGLRPRLYTRHVSAPIHGRKRARVARDLR